MCSYTDSIELFVFTPEAFDSVTASPMIICAGDSSTIMAVPGITEGGPYCASNATSPIDTKIDTVSFAGVSTGTAPLNGGETYTDNTSVTIPVSAGSTYPLTIVKGDNNGGGTFAAWAKVFIDFDQNGTYDPAEEVYSFGAPAATGPIGGLITVPATAINGATGMRVVLRESGSQATTTACGTFTYGETEDYTVLISGGVENTNAGFATIDWTPATSLNMTTGDSVVAQGLLATTMYTAIGTDPNGCMDTAMVTVTVNPAPAVMASAADSVICLGDTTTLTATGADTYVWMPGGLMGDVQMVAPTATTDYIVTGTDTASMCSWSDTVTVAIHDLFYVNASVAPITICEGDSVALNAVDSNLATPFCVPTYGTGTGFGDFIDSVGGFGGLIANQTGAGAAPYYQLFATPVAATAGTAYTVSVTTGSFGGQELGLWIDYNQDSIFQASEQVGQFNGVAGATTVTFNVNIPTTAYNGTTLMRVMDDFSGPTPIMDPCRAATWGETEDYVLDISGATAPPAPVAYTWTWEPGALAGAMQTVYPTADTTYVVTQTHPTTGCTATDSVMVTVNPTPVLAVSANPSNGVCDASDPITVMSGGSAAYTYAWNGTAGSMDTTLSPVVAGTYTVVATDTMTMCMTTDSIAIYVFTPEVFDSVTASPMIICAGDSSTIMAVPGITEGGPYCASNATSPIDTKIDTVSFAGVSTGTAPLNGGETYTDNTSVTIPVSAGSTYPLTIVKGDNNGGGTFAAWAKVFIDFDQNGTYDPAEEVYSFGAPAATGPIGGLITVPATAINGATGMRVVLRESGSQATTTACGTFTYGETEDYTVLISGGVENTNAGFATIDWTPATSLNMTTGDSVVAQGLLATTMYTAIGTDPNGCMDTAMVTVTVNPAPAVMASAADSVICLGDTTTLTATGADTYVWMPGGLMGDVQMVAPTATTDYIVTGTDTASMCSWSDTVTVAIHDLFYVNASVAPITICEGDSVALNAVDSNLATPFCVPTYGTGTGFGDFIDSVGGFGGLIANQTGAGAAPYYQLFATPVAATAGTAYTVSVTTGSFGGQELGLWIDYNQDSIFQASEQVGQFNGVAGATTVTFNVNIPTTAYNGTTLMRVMDDFSGPTPIMDPCRAATWGETEDYVLDISGATAPPTPIAYTWTWDFGALTGAMQTVLPPADSTFVVTQTNPVTGCTATDTVMVSPSQGANGDLTQAMSGNIASMTGTSCDTTMQPNDGSAVSYYDPSCNIMAGVQEPTGGVSLGSVSTCVTVDPTVSNHNGQPYVRRWFDINPTTQGPADVTLYFTDADFIDYNAASGSYDTIATNAGGATTTTICITQVSGGPLGTGTPIVHGPLTATWDAVNMRWDVTFPVTGFSEFYCHTCNFNNTVLPVEYKSFTVTKQATSDLVEWTTATEQNSDVFNILRSGDGQNFETIGTVNSKAPNGTSSSELSYSFVDEKPQVGHNYYRLQQVDFDKNTNLSKVIDIIWGADGSVVSIYPNPARDILNIDLTSNQVVQTEIKLLDMSGRVVKSILSQSQKGLNHITLDLSDIATGVYGVQVFENNKLTHVSKVRKN
jgi:hypothetical protein